MELLQLTYFCHAAESENFSATAKHYGVPASNISQCVKRLEDELGVPLFDRRANRITLNEQGRLFYQKASSALRELKEAKAVLADTKAELTGEIRIKICTNRRVVTEAIEAFRQKHPAVTFAISHHAPEEEEFDCVVSDDDVMYGEMERVLLIRETMVLAASKDAACMKKKDLSLRDLSRERFITMPEGSSMYRKTMELCKRAGFVPNICIQGDDPFYIRKYLAMGLGIALVPSVSWQGQFDEAVELRTVGDFTRSTYLFWDGRRYLSRAVREFLNTLQKTCEAMKNNQRIGEQIEE